MAELSVISETEYLIIFQSTGGLYQFMSSNNKYEEHIRNFLRFTGEKIIYKNTLYDKICGHSESKLWITFK